MSLKEKELYEFGNFRLDVTEHFLARISDGEHIQISEKAFETLCVLVRNAGHLVNKNELLNLVWADSFVEENNLNKCIYAIRRALSEKSGEQKFIETVKKHGFRFVAKVRNIHSEASADTFLQVNGLHSITNKNSSAEFPKFFKQTETQKSGAVVALADWRHETVETETVENFSPINEESINQLSEISLVPIEPKKASKHLTKQRFVLTALAAFLIGIIALGYYFYSSKKILGADGKKSIAVLPVKPINVANRNLLYEIGIADSLILRLGSMNGFSVLPLSATRKYADIEQDAITAGKEQQTDYVLDSNYQLADGKIKITAQLINVENGQIEETYKSEKDSSDIFAMQDAIASEIANILQMRFATTSRSPMAKRGTTNEEAYRLYLQGAALADKWTSKDVRKAIEYFEQAVKLDPNYAPAYSRLASAHTAAVGNRSSDMDEQYPKAKAAIQNALAIDNNLAEAHSYLGVIKSDFEGDFAGAEREHRKAIALNPNSSIAHRMYALLLTCLGRHDEALAESKTAIDLEPASVMNHLTFGRTLLFARRYDEAITELERITEMDSQFFFAHQSLSVVYRLKGEDDRAFESFLKSRILFGEMPDEINLLKTIYAKSGWRGVNEWEFEKEKTAEKMVSLIITGWRIFRLN